MLLRPCEPTLKCLWSRNGPAWPPAHSFLSPLSPTGEIASLGHRLKMSSMDTSMIQPPLDYSDSGLGILITINILALITTIVVTLRFWARSLTRQAFGADDYLCLAALLTHHALMVASCVCVRKGGLGRDMRMTSTEDPYSVVILFQVWNSTTLFPQYGC